MYENCQKKVLIYMNKKQLRPTGGPIGYNYNLFVYMQNHNDSNVYFIESGMENIEAWKKRVDSIKNPKLRKVFIILKKCYKHWKLLYGNKHIACVDLNQFDIIHFHSTLDLYDCRDSLKEYKGKVVLTSHSPTLLSKEIYDGASWFERNVCRFIYGKLIKIDEYAFERADFIFFPCEEAEEPYVHAWKKYEDYKDRNKNKFKYIVTGINGCIAQTRKNEIRKKYGIPEEAFLVSYVGRHNEIKGYDLFKEIGKSFLEMGENRYIIVAGKEVPIKRLDNSRWIEVGWTNDPHSIIAASDVFVLPNRETYFDLIMLEVLSLGKIVIASKTGGNKYFEGKSKAIRLYNNANDCISELEYIEAMSLAERNQLGEENLALYNAEFTTDIFCRNYIKLINEL